MRFVTIVQAKLVWVEPYEATPEELQTGLRTNVGAFGPCWTFPGSCVLEVQTTFWGDPLIPPGTRLTLAKYFPPAFPPPLGEENFWALDRGPDNALDHYRIGLYVKIGPFQFPVVGLSPDTRDTLPQALTRALQESYFTWRRAKPSVHLPLLQAARWWATRDGFQQLGDLLDQSDLAQEESAIWELRALAKTHPAWIPKIREALKRFLTRHTSRASQALRALATALLKDLEDPIALARSPEGPPPPPPSPEAGAQRDGVFEHRVKGLEDEDPERREAALVVCQWAVEHEPTHRASVQAALQRFIRLHGGRPRWAQEVGRAQAILEAARGKEGRPVPAPRLAPPLPQKQSRKLEEAVGPQIEGPTGMPEHSFQVYRIVNSPHTRWRWTVTGGRILSGQGTREIEVEIGHGPADFSVGAEDLEAVSPPQPPGEHR